MTSVYPKPTFSAVFTNFESFIPDIYKRELIEVSDYAPIMRTFNGKLKV